MTLHEKSCMLDSFCIVTGVRPEKAVDIIGHNGSERGFHSQEIIDLANQLGYSITEIQRNPTGLHPITHEEFKIVFPGGNDMRFLFYLEDYDGIVMGLMNGRPHAIAWIDGLGTDPATGRNVYLLSYTNLVEDTFVPMIFLKVNDDRISD